MKKVLIKITIELWFLEDLGLANEHVLQRVDTLALKLNLLADSLCDARESSEREKNKTRTPDRNR